MDYVKFTVETLSSAVCREEDGVPAPQIDLPTAATAGGGDGGCQAVIAGAAGPARGRPRRSCAGLPPAARSRRSWLTARHSGGHRGVAALLGSQIASGPQRRCPWLSGSCSHRPRRGAAVPSRYHGHCGAALMALLRGAAGARLQLSARQAAGADATRAALAARSAQLSQRARSPQRAAHRRCGLFGYRAHLAQDAIRAQRAAPSLSGGVCFWPRSAAR